MPLAPPGVSRRWSVIGHKSDHGECTTILDVPDDDRAHVVLHPGGVTAYTVRIARPAIQVLLDTIESGNACAVPATHPVHGGRLLCLRPATLPNEPPWTDRPADASPYFGPMELYLRLPGAEFSVIFRRERLLRLATALAEILIMENPVAR
jgi:hypothetical protein